MISTTTAIILSLINVFYFQWFKVKNVKIFYSVNFIVVQSSAELSFI